MKTRQHLPSGITLILALLALLLTGTASNIAQAQPHERCFPQTNQCISGPIRAYWERNGGLPIFGYPISPQRVETVEGQALPVQWFERDRLEDHGSAGIMAGRLGARYLALTDRPWEYFDTLDPATVPAGCQFFAPTGHSLCEPYLSYWRAHGGLLRFGYPITQPFAESIETSKSDTQLVEVQRFEAQYFERRRMEIHPELAGTPILLGLLGSEVLRTPEPSTPYPDCLSHAPPSLLPAIAKLHLGAPIGCPAGAAWVNLPAATQQFEHGAMIWLSERKTYPLVLGYPPTIITLIDPGPRADVYTDTWQAGRDPDTASATPPRAGLYAPWQGFGKLWMEHPDVREAIGWAIEPQAQPRSVDTQLFRTALLVRMNETGIVYAFGNANNSPYAQVITP